MKITELRIGNYFDVIDRTNTIHFPLNVCFKVYSIEPFKISGCEHKMNFCNVKKMHEFDIKDLSPIVLSEGWLLKFGFEKINGVFKKKLRNDLFIRCSFHKNILGIVLDDIFEAVDKRETVILNPVEFVHQLQNLYYALTGEELTIK